MMKPLFVLLLVLISFGFVGPSAEVRAQDEELLSISLSDVPLEHYRRVANFLAQLQMEKSETFAAWQSPTIRDEVFILRRPDIEGAAYYEFQLEPSGFIITSTGGHDFPIPHYSADDQSPVQYLQENAEGEIARIYKLDALYYVAEDSSGQIVAQLGTPISRIEGLDLAALETPADFSGSASSQPSEATRNDQTAEGIEHEFALEGYGEAPLEFQEWDSWDTLKSEYATVYELFIEDLRNLAAYDWETESLITEFGLGVLAHTTLPLPLLYSNTEFEVQGEGAQYVSYRARDIENFPVLEIFARETPPQSEVDVNISLFHPTGQTEELIVFVVEGEPSNKPRFETLALAPTAQTFAGTRGNQRFYSQFDIGGCASGCGATAWAMLFGWADHQAALGNAYWLPRWGLYRQDGGFGADADAPAFMTNGIRNITSEIRSQIGTFCFFGSGATPPWSMGGAWRYLSGRTGTRLETHWNSLGIHEGGLRDRARNSIVNRRTPAIIGTGWLSHYPLAYGYGVLEWIVRRCFFGCWESREYNPSFWVNQGWGGSGDGWIIASTWFDGEIFP